MRIGVPKEMGGVETRVPLLPEGVARLLKKPGIEILVEHGLGDHLGLGDDAYAKAGAKPVARGEILSTADVILRIQKPEITEIPLIKKGAVHVSFLDPFRDTETVPAMAAAGITAVSLEMIPRTTRAQRMDVLSSQANLAGYVSVTLAARELPKVFPMMMTPAGTLPPAKVLVIGVGVAGLQAIATANRLGARVEAFDTRPETKEQVLSLGARFVEIDLGETKSEGGYAKQLTDAQLALQRAGLAKVIAASDVVITTAQVFGRPAPRIVTADMVAGMKAGSLLIDLAVETGGNIEGSKPGETVATPNGARILGLRNLPGLVPAHASLMLTGNFAAFVEEFYDKETGTFPVKLEDDILKGCVLTHGGAVVHEKLKKS